MPQSVVDTRIKASDINVPTWIKGTDIDIPMWIKGTDANIPMWIKGSDISIPMWIKGTDASIPMWIKGSDAPLGLYDVLVRGAAYYVQALLDYVPLLTSDPALKLEPTPTAETRETTRFTRYILLAYASTPRTFLCSLAFSGTGHIYVRLLTGTYYYKMYAKLMKTSDFRTFTDITGEVTLMNYSRGAADTDGWYDEGEITGVLNAKVNMDAGEALLLVLRGTSWSNFFYETSTGINTTNLRIYATVLT